MDVTTKKQAAIAADYLVFGRALHPPPMPNVIRPSWTFFFPSMRLPFASSIFKEVAGANGARIFMGSLCGRWTSWLRGR